VVFSVDELSRTKRAWERCIARFGRLYAWLFGVAWLSWGLFVIGSLIVGAPLERAIAAWAVSACVVFFAFVLWKLRNANDYSAISWSVPHVKPGRTFRLRKWHEVALSTLLMFVVMAGAGALFLWLSVMFGIIEMLSSM
jgi:hypothetical protein